MTSIYSEDEIAIIEYFVHRLMGLLKLYKTNKKSKLLCKLINETVSDISETIGFYMTVTSGIEAAAEYVKTIESMTIQDVNSAAAEYLSVNKAVISVLMPE